MFSLPSISRFRAGGATTAKSTKSKKSATSVKSKRSTKAGTTSKVGSLATGTKATGATGTGRSRTIPLTTASPTGTGVTSGMGTETGSGGTVGGTTGYTIGAQGGRADELPDIIRQELRDFDLNYTFYFAILCVEFVLLTVMVICSILVIGNHTKWMFE